jgi:hypothetical protein
VVSREHPNRVLQLYKKNIVLLGVDQRVHDADPKVKKPALVDGEIGTRGVSCFSWKIARIITI